MEDYTKVRIEIAVCKVIIGFSQLFIAVFLAAVVYQLWSGVDLFRLGSL